MNAPEFHQELPPLYEPLNDPLSTRLVSIIPGDIEDSISCTLTAVSLETLDRPYIGLSYTWGDLDHQERIRCNGHEVTISRNLYSALRRLRTTLANGPELWIDALSINQARDSNGLREREQQVQMMNRIFTQAVSVIIDLGDIDDEVSKLAIGLIVKVSSLLAESGDNRAAIRNNFAKHGLSSEEDDAWRAWSSLMSRSWFRRLWVVQEFVLTQKPVMLFGHCLFDGELLQVVAPVISFLHQYFPDIGTSIEAQKGINNMQMMFLLRYERKQGKLHNLELLFKRFREFNVTDPRDRVYALQGMVNDGSKRFTVDYSASCELVAERFMTHLISSSGNLLCLALTNGPAPGRTSWAPDIEASEPVLPWGIFGTKSSGYQHFRAGANTTSNVILPPSNGSKRSLVVFGSICDSILDCNELILRLPQRYVTPDPTWQPAEMPHIRAIVEWESYAIDLVLKYRDVLIQASDKPLKERMWKTIVFNSTRQGKELPPEFVQYRNSYDRMRRFLFGPARGADAELQTEEGFLKLVYEAEPYSGLLGDTVPGNKFCVTGKGRIGMIPGIAGPNDHIAILYGAGMPVVVREMDKGVQLIGPCFIDGLMEGQAVLSPDWKPEGIVFV
jgi:hypothetical protein